MKPSLKLYSGEDEEGLTYEQRMRKRSLREIANYRGRPSRRKKRHSEFDDMVVQGSVKGFPFREE